MAASAETVDERRAWWTRTLLVLAAPRAVFAALREQDPEDVAARQEPLLAVTVLAGIAGVLATSVAGRLMDDPSFDGLLVAVWAFIGGGVYGLVGYWGGGALLHGATKLLGSRGNYRRARQVLGFAAVPVALSLFTLWPVRIAAFGGAVFRSGGADSGSAGTAFALASVVFVLWSLGLLAVGVRTVHGWEWGRSAAAILLAAAPIVLLVVATRR